MMRGIHSSRGKQMRTRRGFLLATVALVPFGCKPVESGSDEPMPTDGPDQVVIKVPGMT
jgi:hypothetical protein